jgi:succinyl-diaminopimelate desuccinylase
VSPEPAKEQTDVGFERLLDAVLARIDREELIHLTQELVRIPSVHRPEEPDGNEARTARFLADYLDQAGFEVQTEEVAPGRPNVWAVWEGDRPGRTLLFEAHTDVVTEGRARDWNHAPFGAERMGLCLRARGVRHQGEPGGGSDSGACDQGLQCTFSW